MRIERNTFTLPSGTTSLLNGGTVSLQSNCTVTSGILLLLFRVYMPVLVNYVSPTTIFNRLKFNGIDEQVMELKLNMNILKCGYRKVKTVDVLECRTRSLNYQ